VIVNNNIDYLYDNIDRLISATNQLSGSTDESFSYDILGNRLTESGQISQSIFNSNNQLIEDQVYTYQYDLNGNLIQKTNKSTLEVTTYTYDAENRLIELNKGGTVSTYKYSDSVIWPFSN